MPQWALWALWSIERRFLREAIEKLRECPQWALWAFWASWAYVLSTEVASPMMLLMDYMDESLWKKVFVDEMRI